jgi:hypothetical protein
VPHQSLQRCDEGIGYVTRGRVTFNQADLGRLHLKTCGPQAATNPVDEIMPMDLAQGVVVEENVSRRNV